MRRRVGTVLLGAIGRRGASGRLRVQSVREVVVAAARVVCGGGGGGEPRVEGGV